jgi:hypothetical protein
MYESFKNRINGGGVACGRRKALFSTTHDEFAENR